MTITKASLGPLGNAKEIANALRSLDTERAQLIAAVNGILSPTIHPWTAADASGAGLVITTTLGDSVKVGSLVFANFVLSYPVTADGSVAKISGLPYTSMNDAVSSLGGYIAFTNTVLEISMLIPVNSKVIQWLLDTGTAVINSQLSGKNIRGMVIYRTAE